MTNEQTQLVEDNLPLVGFVIKRHFKSWLYVHEYEDLFQIGCVGLINAAIAFDPERDLKFSSLAVRSIKNEIMKIMQSKTKRDRIMRPLHAVRLDDEELMFDIEDRNDLIRLADLRMDITETLKDVIPPQREAFNLRVNQGLTYQEASDICGRSRQGLNHSMKVVGRTLRKAGISP